MNLYGQTSNKRDFEMAMGYDGSGAMPPQAPGSFMAAGAPPAGYFYPGQVPFSGQQMGMQMPMGGFDPHGMPFMQPRFYPAGMGPQMGEAPKEPAAKTNADWALEKRRARNRITAAESRRKCKEEIQNLRDELVRLKEEKQEKEDLIEYYRNRYERFEDTGEGATEKAKEGAEKSENSNSEKPAEKPSSPPVVVEQPVVSAKQEEAESKTESTDATLVFNDATTRADTESVDSGSAPGSSDSGDSVQE